MCLNQARYGISWGAIGAAMSCYDTALQYSLLRKQFRDEPIASHQLVQEKLTWMISEISKAQLLSLHVGRLKDQGKVGHEHISMAKRNNVWMALECARLSRDILGGNGITDDYPIMRHMMNLESVKTYEGTHDIHTLIIGQSRHWVAGLLGTLEPQIERRPPMFLDDLLKAVWRWWCWRRRVKQFRSWNPTDAEVKSCKVMDDTLGERLELVFHYEVRGEGFWGSTLSQKRRTDTTSRLEDDVLEGHRLSIRVSPIDPNLCGVLNEDNPQWPWAIEE